MMASLPSYREATERPHWITIVAPHVAARDYARLCLVDNRFHAEFAPRMWKDPFKTIRLLGRHPAEDTRRLQYFLTTHVERMRLATRSLVLCLDFRDLGLTAYHFFEHQLWNGAKSQENSSRLASAFPQLRCILLDGTPEWLVDSIARDLEISPGSPTTLACLMFTARKTATVFRPAFFLSPLVKSVVYLDLSYAPGSLKATLLAASLPCLRILKVQGREISDDAALSIFALFKQQLWSLDLSDNKLTDAPLEPLVLSTFPATNSRTAAHHDVEGSLKWVANVGEAWYGRFGFIEESEHSSVFNHPRRHLADPPVYTSHAELASGDQSTVRHNGRRPVRRDTPESVKQILLGKPDRHPQAYEGAESHDIRAAHGGITHLRLNGNGFSLQGIERLIRESPGQLEHFECDSALIEIPAATLNEKRREALRHLLPRWLAPAKFTGFVGASHLFRPVFCPQLQVLRIHHSLLSQIPSINAENVTVGDSLWIAEAFFEPRAAMAFPQVFAPDMNPRLYSLTLTNVPRYSTGPFIVKILNFLRQASDQERKIQDTNAAHSLRVSASLNGLRHIHLEFGEDPREAAPDALDLEGMDAAKLLGPEDEEFSFFAQSDWASSSLPTSDPQTLDGGQRLKNDRELFHAETPLFRPENPPPYRPGYAETQDQYEHHHGDWNGQVFAVPVWVGRGVSGPHSAVNEYMRLLKDPYLTALHTNVGPASPSHVLAGVPAGSYIYHAAWDAIMAPPVVRKPTAAELGEMRDVVAAIKEYRAKTKSALSTAQQAAGTLDVPLGEPHYHWSGKLDISFPSVSHDSGMWR
ncbi:hypothetical protein CONLIGDRAFT_459262 [Coniochaeta ligniaria NRRL 30616]|uniref:Leucine rich repeat domain-containing protein n=1 Tax=Coniochaeta ligniaria NRRL 30616 TaxID=1408157 RepID=A0A1J7IL53_9PEZI|nr:hypothetical protein CONLIGDRAFT_459262 [Coniochaeta ligniaria NRRL 30616]